MKDERYKQLEKAAKVKLTEEEKQDGWHFCREWDGMLIHSSWPEYESCICKLKYK